MPENQTQPRTDGYENPQGGPRISDQAPEARGEERPVSDTEAAHAPNEGPALRDPTLGAPRPDPLTHGMHGGHGKDRREDYGNAPGIEGKGDAVRAPDDIEARVAAADAHQTAAHTEQNPGRDR